jgi:hypothetical protein
MKEYSDRNLKERLLGSLARDVRELGDIEAELPFPRQPLLTWYPACTGIAL